MGLLAFACEEHTNGVVDSHPTVGVCWDGDRLNLWRVESSRTRVGSRRRRRGAKSVLWARDLQWERCSWEELCQSLELR
jgi:hypothetical protein